MRIHVDQARCHGHQMCAIAAPEVFGSDEIGNAVVLVEGDLPRELEAAARRAEGNCPERAIEISSTERLAKASRSVRPSSRRTGPRAA